jgi:hypothetical protein
MKQMEFAANMQIKEQEIIAERERMEFEREKHQAEMVRAERTHTQKLTEMAAMTKAKAANVNKKPKAEARA